MSNMKDAFYQIISHFQHDKDHLAKILLGPACEHWLRSESSYALNFGEKRYFQLKNHEYVYEENKKRDITFYNAYDKPKRVIEIKAIYPLDTFSIKDKWLLPLKKQLLTPKKGENGVRYVGLIFAIWLNDYKDKITEANYYSNLSGFLKDIFPSKEFTTQHGYYFEPILSKYKVNWLKENYEISLKATYLTLKKPLLRARS
ncbi:MAG: hypothetical protein JW913_08215 [Chitinispirillaceae bacterium]|nr:hypothetical protein [Chitinispirillaceae bacterium]